jgi:CBS domain-containing protein
MALVRHLLYLKGKDVWSVPPTATIQEALRLLEKHDIGVLLVMEDERLVGILSERDVVRKMARTNQADLNAQVQDYMTSNIFFVEPSNSVEECMKLMTARHIRHLPVLDQKKVVGVISINDLVREIIADQDSTIKSLENYIAGQSNPS